MRKQIMTDKSITLTLKFDTDRLDKSEMRKIGNILAELPPEFSAQAVKQFLQRLETGEFSTKIFPLLDSSDAKAQLRACFEIKLESPQEFKKAVEAINSESDEVPDNEPTEPEEETFNVGDLIKDNTTKIHNIYKIVALYDYNNDLWNIHLLNNSTNELFNYATQLPVSKARKIARDHIAAILSHNHFTKIEPKPGEEK
jgi:hypothetical protein